jgi:pimeloyl-ACP methyl ester carboxylesterase
VDTIHRLDSDFARRPLRRADGEVDYVVGPDVHQHFKDQVRGVDLAVRPQDVRGVVAFWPAEATRDAPPALRRCRPAATSMRLGLHDECWLFVNTVALGAGTPLSATSATRSSSRSSRRGRSPTPWSRSATPAHRPRRREEQQLSNYVQLGEVHTYYEEDGEGDPLMLLHPGLADSRAFEDYVPELAQHFHVFRPDRRGHGRTPDVDGPITYELMGRDTIAFLEQVIGGPAYLLGHSDGAPVALLAALERPDLVRGLVFSGGVFHHEGWAPGATDLDDETVAFFIDYWGAVAPDGPEDFSVVKAKLDRMHREEPTLTVADLAGYPGPALVMVGDGDEEIPMEHTLALREGLPDAQLAVLPGTGHGGIDTRIVIDFLTERQEEA